MADIHSSRVTLSEIHCGSHFSGHFRSIQIFFEILDKMAASGHFGCPKIVFGLISVHFTSIRNFIFFEIFDKMTDVGHFGCPNFTFDRISGHFRSIHNFNFFRIVCQNG